MCAGGQRARWRSPPRCRGVEGTCVAVAPSQMLSVAGVVGQGGGVGMDWAKSSCSVQIFEAGSLLASPHPRELPVSFVLSAVET